MGLRRVDESTFAAAQMLWISTVNFASDDRSLCKGRYKLTSFWDVEKIPFPLSLFKVGLSAKMTTTNFVHFEHAPPKSWDHFEEICADIFQREWRDNALVRHGRAGQKQHGVDIVGRVGAVWPVGVQCKKKSH